MKKFSYQNTEMRMHRGRSVLRQVHVTGNKGTKSVTLVHKGRTHTQKKPLCRKEIKHIKNRTFIKGLFDDCY